MAQHPHCSACLQGLERGSSTVWRKVPLAKGTYATYALYLPDTTRGAACSYVVGFVRRETPTNQRKGG